MKNSKPSVFGLNRFELGLWCTSVLIIFLSSVIVKTSDPLSIIGSLIGVTSLIFLAKGYNIGQILIIIFSLFYGAISFFNHYYGEMITYMCMTLPMAVVALVQWMKNPYMGTKEVKVSKVTKKHIYIICATSLIISVAFYFILNALGNASLLISTFSVATSYVAAYLTAVRSPYYALGYACNDLVLILLWIIASTKDANNVSMVVCFVMFLINDLYGFYSWKNIEKRQKSKT